MDGWYPSKLTSGAKRKCFTSEYSKRWKQTEMHNFPACPPQNKLQWYIKQSTIIYRSSSGQKIHRQNRKTWRTHTHTYIHTDDTVLVEFNCCASGTSPTFLLCLRLFKQRSLWPVTNCGARCPSKERRHGGMAQLGEKNWRFFMRVPPRKPRCKSCLRLAGEAAKIRRKRGSTITKRKNHEFFASSCCCCCCCTVRNGDPGMCVWSSDHLATMQCVVVVHTKIRRISKQFLKARVCENSHSFGFGTCRNMCNWSTNIVYPCMLLVPTSLDMFIH